MRFKSSIKSVPTFVKLTSSLNLLAKVAWLRLDNDLVRFTIVPERGTQGSFNCKCPFPERETPIVAFTCDSLANRPSPSSGERYIQDSVFDDDYLIQSAAPNNTINLEVPLAPLSRALRSAQNAISASIRLTKKDGNALLSLTIVVQSPNVGTARPLLEGSGRSTSRRQQQQQAEVEPDPFAGPLDGLDGDREDGDGLGLGMQPGVEGEGGLDLANAAAPLRQDTTITQDIHIMVLPPAAVEGIHEPRCSEPEVHILLPPLLQLKSVSERFVKLAASSSSSSSSAKATAGGGSAGAFGFQSTASGSSSLAASGPKLELSANMHGELRLGITTDALRIESRWSGLTNPELDPGMVDGGEEGIREHPSTRMKELTGDEGWATVRVEGRDWSRVLGVGRMGGRVVACFCHDRALILYVYLPSDDETAEESVLTYYVTSYSA